MNHRSDSLADTPQGQNILRNQKAVQALLSKPETQKFFQVLKKKDAEELQAAAKAALQGDASLLNTLMQDLSKNPETAKAVETLSKDLPR